jgi:hypothetical protein
MAFSSSSDGTAPTPEPALRVTGDTRFYLEDEFFFLVPEYAASDFQASADPATHSVENGAQVIQVVPRDTDLASVPKVLWGLMASYGRQTLPALLHDQLCDAANSKRDVPSTRAEGFADRCRADNMFRHGLRSVGMDWMRRWTFWAGVCFGRYLTFNWLIAVALAVYALVLSALFYSGVAGVVWAVGWKVGLLAGPGWPSDLAPWQLGSAGVGAMLAPFVLSMVVFRRRLWTVMWVGSYVGIPVLLLVLLGSFVLFWTRFVPWLVQSGLSLLPGVDFNPGPRPPFTPTGLRPM